MDISKRLVLEILFLPLMTCVLNLATRALDSYEDSTGEYLFVDRSPVYEAFSLITCIFLLTNDRGYRILIFFKLMPHETKEIHRKLVTTFGHIQGFQYVSHENLVRFYLHSFVIFAVHCYPLIFILFLNLDGMIPTLLGVLFTMSLLFESIDASDRLVRIVRFASCITFVCIYCGLIVFQLFECFFYTTLTLLFVVFWMVRPNQRPFYLIFNFLNRSPEEVALEPIHNVDIPEGSKERLVENEERVLEQLGENAFQDEMLEPQDGFQLMKANHQLPQREDRPMTIKDYQLVFNEMVRRSLEREQMNPVIDRDQIVPEQLNQWIDRDMEPEQLNNVFGLR